LRKSIKYLLFAVCLLPELVFAAPKFEMELRPDGLHISNANVAILQKLYEDYGYADFIHMPDWQYPPIFLTNMPTDFHKIEDQNLRNKLFMQILGPLALRVSEEILLERYELMKIRDHFKEHKTFTEEQQKQLDAWASTYDVFTRMTGNERYDILVNELLYRIDVVPPSLLIAAAAAESNWGTAEELRKTNSLYKTEVWYTDEGVKPKNDEDGNYRLKIYPSLLDSMRAYALRLNSNVNFEQFRDHRYQLRRRDKPIRGRAVVYNMRSGSPLQNYAGMISYILTFYDLINFDEATLAPIDMFGKK